MKPIGLALLFALASSAFAATWAPAGKPQVYTRANLYEYIDGGADYYLAYGFRKVTVQRYRQGRDEITVELYDMGSPSDAFGAWSNNPPLEQPPVGQQAAYAAGLLQFWKGPVYGRVFAARETPELKRAVIALGKEAATAIEQTGRLPDLLKALPMKGRVPRSERYLHQETSLNNVLYLGGKNPLGLSAKAEAVFARYGPKGETKLLIVRYPSRAAAQQAYQRVRALPKSAKLAMGQTGGMGVASDASGRGYLLLLADRGGMSNAEFNRLSAEAARAARRLR
jgi:hypothetical protein